MLSEILNRPFYNNPSLHYRGRQAFVFGLFVFLFLVVFQPFGLSNLPSGVWIAAAGFGSITFACMVLLNIGVPKLFGSFFEEETWTVRKEIFYTLVNISVIGLGNFLFFCYYFQRGFSLSSLLGFQFITATVGVFPVTVLVLLSERKSRHKYSTEAESLSEELVPKPEPVSQAAQLVTLTSQNTSESFTIEAAAICYLKAADNYIEVFYLQNTLQKRLIRNTLKAAEEALGGYPFLFRCHKSYLVNLNRISKISGNAQGYKLHLAGIAEPVPVSRQNNAAIKQLLSH